MKVVLLQDVEKLGAFGAQLEVSDGYARNYLIPRKMALTATAQNVRLMEMERKNRLITASRLKSEADEIAKRLEGISCTISKQAGENDKLFGSVTAADVADCLAEEGIKLDKKCLQMDAPMKALGIYNIPVKLHPEVTATLKVWVVKA